ncbi:MAG: histidine ammonia-lyase [Gemmatimonadota bacterium]
MTAPDNPVAGVLIDGRTLSLADVERVARGAAVGLAPEARARMEASRRVVEAAVERGEVVYGVTTGFGRLADSLIPTDRIRELQLNLVRSHAVGVGDAFAEPVARAITLLRANTLAGGHGGVRPVVCERLLELLDAGIWPRIPAQGSVGASGDLAPLAHLALVLIGEGEARMGVARGGSGTSAAAWRPAADVLAAAGLAPLELHAKEGLSLINGTQIMTALGVLTLLRAERLVEEVDAAGALSLEATLGTRTAFRAEIHQARPHPGQLASAARLRELLGEQSELGHSHIDCDRVQDAYSFRCMPQVHGAARDTLAHVRKVIEIEVNAATDNPLVFLDHVDEADRVDGADGADGADGDHSGIGGAVLSGGNFHGAPVAAALDFLAIAMTDLASISERRVAAIVDPGTSGLPAFLADEPGIQSGFMMQQVTAAALVSECKSLAHPASVDSIPTSANKEDHVSMGVWAARKAEQVVANAERVVAIELLAAARGIDLRRPLKTSPALEALHAQIRERVPARAEDRAGSDEIETVAAMIREGELQG